MKTNIFALVIFSLLFFSRNKLFAIPLDFVKQSDNILVDLGNISNHSTTELNTFDIENLNENVKINFTVDTEINLKNFLIEVSRDGSYWQEVASVSIENSTDENRKYSVVDKSPFHGLSYYRIKGIFNDGKIIELGLLSNYYSSTKYLNYPIPVNNNMFLEGIDLNSTKIRVLNSLGGEIEVENNLVGDKISFDFSEIKSGVYFLEVFNNITKSVERILVIHI